MKEFDVVVTDSASADITEAYDWIATRSLEGAIRWYDGLSVAIQGLSRMLGRCALAREGEECGIEVHQLLYGRRPNVYRVLFIVQRRRVAVLHVRHAARAAMNPQDILFPNPDL